MPDCTFACPDLTAFCRLGELGLQVLGQRLEPDRAVLACRVTEPDQWCRRCGCEGAARDSVTRRLAHEPLGWRPTTLLVTVRRHQCTGCGHVWRQDTGRAAEPRAKLSRRALRWALDGLVVQHLTGARIAEALAVSWDTANDAVLAEGRRVLINDPDRFDVVAVIGVDDPRALRSVRGPIRVASHPPRRQAKYVTVIIDLTPIRDRTGPSRLLDMVEGRSKQALKTWLAARPEAWRKGLEVVAMDGFTGFKTATTEELTDAVAVMDPFHVVRLAGNALDRCRRRVQQDLHGHRGRKDDPLYRARRTLHTGHDLLTDRQRHRLTALFGVEDHVQVEATWGIYQRNFRQRQMTVNRQIPREGDTYVVRAPKYGSERVVYLPDEVLDVLAGHLQAHLGADPAPGRWLFTVAGEPMYDNAVTWGWRATRRAAGLERVRLHDLRHFDASGVIADGCHVVTVQRSLGHATATTALNTYSHLWPTAGDRTRAAASRLARAALGQLPERGC